MLKSFDHMLNTMPKYYNLLHSQQHLVKVIYEQVPLFIFVSTLVIKSALNLSKSQEELVEYTQEPSLRDDLGITKTDS
jgi:hypothetical protein